MVNSKQRNQFFVLGFHAAGSAFAASREPFVAVFPIHAPVKGATSQLGKALTGQDHFNPRSRERSDMRFGIADHNRDNFNRRSRERSDSHSSKPTTVWTYFNPRSREGSDLLRSRGFCAPIHFNPRSREGSDQSCGWQPTRVSVFQSTLP